MTTETPTTNEAAERLRVLLFNVDTFTADGDKMLDDALAAERLLERQATVERIGNGANALMWQDAHGNWVIAIEALTLVLDEEAAR